MTKLELKHISKTYGDGTEAVRGVDIDVAGSELLALLGPSGCGKSTLLRMIAGLEEITEGEIYLDAERIDGREPKDRHVAMVFQSYALYPHLTVYENMAFGLRIRKIPKKEIERRVSSAAKALELGEILDKKPAALSGGQRQRVALGRAMVREPKLFLLDEPLSNLDAKLRVQMRREIVELQRSLGVAMIYVTHDQTEAMTMADRIVVMDRGKVQQTGTPEEIYRRPENLFVATFIGAVAMNLVSEEEAKALGIALPPEEAETVVGIRPEDLALSEGEDFTVRMAENHGALRYYDVEGNARRYKVMSAEEKMLDVGSKVSLELKEKGSVHRFSKKTGLRLGD